ncbi:MAG: sulfite exporter TauE/SafE family protein [Pararhodobacter sp.]|nr:sulfite exporter TauE/SafE family protein [Pararhodobacter sp.]
MTLFDDPQVLLAALVAVALVGLSKGGLGGAFALMGVPVMALVLPPVQAAALLLPILLMMDAVSLWAWRGWFSLQVLRAMLPAAVLGIALGWATAAFTSDAAVRLIVGAVALGFVARMVWVQWIAASAPAAGHRPGMAWLWGSVAGFTSFVAHAGGPPFQVYTLPMRMDPRLYTGTSVVFFAVVNTVKVAPYAALGMFDTRLVLSALAMLPLAVLAVLAGAALVKRMRASIFYPFMYVMVTLVGAKLVHDGVMGLI